MAVPHGVGRNHGGNDGVVGSFATAVYSRRAAAGIIQAIFDWGGKAGSRVETLEWHGGVCERRITSQERVSRGDTNGLKWSFNEHCHRRKMIQVQGKNDKTHLTCSWRRLQLTDVNFPQFVKRDSDLCSTKKGIAHPRG